METEMVEAVELEELAEADGGAEQAAEEGDAALLARLRERYDTAALREYRMVRGHPADLYIPEDDEETLKGSVASMAGSIGLFGILQAPAVLLRADGVREVIFGRRRVLAARRAGEVEIEWREYEGVTRPQLGLLILTENISRAPAWVRDVRTVAELRDAGTLLTERELKAVLGGRRLPYIRELLRMAALPEPILNVIFAGHVSQRLAARLCRLKGRELDRAAELALAGELTEESVEHALRAMAQSMSRPLAALLDAPEEPEALPEPVAAPAPAPAVATSSKARKKAERTVDGGPVIVTGPRTAPEPAALDHDGLTDALRRAIAAPDMPGRARAYALALLEVLRRK